MPTYLQSEQFKQAVLDAISEQIAVINENGRIVETNAAWRDALNTRYAALNGTGAEENYLELCRADANHDAIEMRTLAEGIRGVLLGKLPRFHTEFRRANRRDGDRWFQVSITPLPRVGAVLVHEDVTERKILEREIISISDYERAQMGRDLHDGLCQVLGGMMLSTAVIAASLKKQNSPEASEMTRLVEIARDATNQARELSRSLHPVEVDGHGLSAALQDLAAQANSRVPCTFHCANEITTVDSDAALSLFRIAQEALRNAIRHANASSIVISLSMRRSHLILKVEDDGVGFSETDPNPGDGALMGLQVMRYRASAIGARLQIRQRADSAGTRVSCVLPTI
jgi:PAS domain S-box-containing protein